MSLPLWMYFMVSWWLFAQLCVQFNPEKAARHEECRTCCSSVIPINTVCLEEKHPVIAMAVVCLLWDSHISDWGHSVIHTCSILSATCYIRSVALIRRVNFPLVLTLQVGRVCWVRRIWVAPVRDYVTCVRCVTSCPPPSLASCQRVSYPWIYTPLSLSWLIPLRWDYTLSWLTPLRWGYTCSADSP